jgi:benzoyl-CoA reductase/2-hydroxyglutaryl-CoA dehydratase subunit BcrC/BadD/HgdB
MGDYRKLWESLDMDLEKHDILCAVLPEVYEDIYLNQNNRPESMNYFNFVMSEIHGLRVEELARHRSESGKVVGTFCVFVPDEVILAAKAVGVGLCGGSQFWIPDGETVVPRNLCPLIKAVVGAKVSGTCPYFQSCDLLVGETTCDGKKKAWEILNEYTPVHVMDLPQMKREKDVNHWEEEIRAFMDKVEELTGNEITAAALKDAIKLVNRKRAALSRLYAARKASPVPISGKDALLVTQIAFYDDPERFISNVEELCDELETRIKEGKGVFSAETPRLMVAGTPMAIPNWKLHHVIETNGAAIVCEETCTGTRYFENLVSEQPEDLDGMLKALADRYMKINCACFTPNEGRVDDILRLAKEYNVDGVVYYNLQFCHTYNVEYVKIEKALKEAGIPVIMIETDYSEQDVEQIKTRLEAFLEIIK